MQEIESISWSCGAGGRSSGSPRSFRPKLGTGFGASSYPMALRCVGGARGTFTHGSHCGGVSSSGLEAHYWGGRGGGGSRNLRLVVFCRNRRNPLEVTFRVLPGPPSWGCEAVPQSRWEEKTRGQGYWLLARLVSAVLETAGQAGTEVLAQPCGVASGGGPRMRGLKQSRRHAELVFPFKRRHKLFIINSYGSNRIGGCSLGEK